MADILDGEPRATGAQCDPREIARRVLTRREVLSITQAELAKQAIVNVRTIRNVELAATAQPRAATLKRIADVLNVELGHLGLPDGDEGPRPAASFSQPAGASAGFIGRDAEIAQLNSLLTTHPPQTGRSAVFLLIGAAGIGKTSLALRWAGATKARFPGGQAYGNLRGLDPTSNPMSPTEAMRSVIDQLTQTEGGSAVIMTELGARYLVATGRGTGTARPQRSVFRTVGGVLRRLPIDLDRARAAAIDVRNLSGLDDDALHLPAHALAEVPFRLEQDAPIRFTLLCRDGHDDALLITVHHIVVDDIASVAILRDLVSGYAARVVRAPHERASEDDAAGLDDYVRRQRAYLDSRQAGADATYWRTELSTMTVPLDLVADHPRPAVYRPVSAEVGFPGPPELTAAVRDAVARHNVTPFAYLMSVFQVLLYEYSGRIEFVVGYPVTHRSAARHRQTVGYFVSKRLERLRGAAPTVALPNPTSAARGSVPQGPEETAMRGGWRP